MQEINITSGWPISRILSDKGGPVYAPKSVFPALYLDGHLSKRPTRDSDETSSLLSLRGLAPGGGCLAARIAADAGGLLHRLFTFTLAGSLFLWPDPADYPARGLLRSGITPAPCPVECGLSSTRHSRARPRPSGRPEDDFIIPEQGGLVNI